MNTISSMLHLSALKSSSPAELQGRAARLRSTSAALHQPRVDELAQGIERARQYLEAQQHVVVVVIVVLVAAMVMVIVTVVIVGSSDGNGDAVVVRMVLVIAVATRKVENMITAMENRHAQINCDCLCARACARAFVHCVCVCVCVCACEPMVCVVCV